MVKSKLLDPKKIELDRNNPRFSLFDFKNEKDVIEYLFKYEDIKNLALQMIKNGYITLGERIIVLESLKNGKKKYVVLEGNRRIAALKLIFTEPNRFNSADRERINKLNSEDYFVDCDVIEEHEENEARFKITAKHIDGIKAWSPTDKRVFYDNLFTQHRDNGKSKDEALIEIEKVTPESKAKIRNALKNHRFLSVIYEATKSIKPELDHFSHLESDVLISRVQQRIKDTLGLIEDDNFYLNCREGKEEEFIAILKSLGEATWINHTLDTRTFSTKSMWENILTEDKVIPGLEDLIKAYLFVEELPGENEPDIKTEVDEKELPQDNQAQDIEEDKVENDENPKDTEFSYEDGDMQKKYKMFVSEQRVDVKSLGYELTENINILDENNNHISKNSSVFQKVIFSTTSKNIAVQGNKILSVSENGKYEIKVKFFDIEKSYWVILNITRPKKQTEDKHDLFSEEWFNDSVALLSSKEKYSNIISVLKCLNENKDISKNSDSFVMLSFLIRILIEYSSKAYWDEYRSDQTKPSSLTNYISSVSSYLYTQKIITKEEKKSFSNGNDLETLNAQIHDYKSNISSISIDSIFKAYKIYLNKLFLELNK